MAKEITVTSIGELDAYFGYDYSGGLTSWFVISVGTRTWTRYDAFGLDKGEYRSLIGVFFLSGWYRVVGAVAGLKIAEYAVEFGASVDTRMYHRISSENWRGKTGWGTGDITTLYAKAANEHSYYTMPQAEYGVAGWKTLPLGDEDLEYVNTWGHTALWSNIHGGPTVGETCKWTSGGAPLSNRPYLTVQVEPATARAKHGHACGPMRAYAGGSAPG